MKKNSVECKVLICLLGTCDVISNSGPVVGSANDPLEMPEVPLV